MYNIVCIEDNLQLAMQIRKALLKFNYNVILVDDFKHIDQFIFDHEPHLVILDINLPYHDGFYWCQKIRQASNVPILFMSSRDDNLDQVMALSMGGDDYIIKPIDINLAIIKIQALLRRSYAYEISNSNLLKTNNLILDINKMVVCHNDDNIELTKNEFKILQKLMLHKNEYVSRQDLMEYLWNNDSFIDDNAFNTNMSRLRKKLDSKFNHDFIINKRSVGYKVEA